MADDVQVQFGAKTDGIDQGVADVNSKLKELQSQTEGMKSGFDSLGSTMTSSFSQAGDALTGLNDNFKSINDTIKSGGASLDTGWMKLLLGAGVGGAVAGVVKLFHDLEEEFLKMDTNAREAGLSLQRFQEIQFGLAKSGVGTDKMVSDLQSASKKLTELQYDAGSLGKFLDANNIKWKDSAGNIISMDEYLKQAATLIQQAGTEGNGVALKVGEMLGLSREFVRSLADGPAGMRLTADEARKAGAVIDPELVQRAAKFEQEWNRASLAWAVYFKSLLAEILPYVERLINALKDGLQIARDKVDEYGAAWDRLHPKGDTLLDTVKKTWDAWRGATSELERFGAVWDAVMHGTETFSQRFDAAKGSLSTLTDSAKALLTTSTSTANAWKNMDGEMGDMVVKGKEFDKIKFPGSDKDKFDPTAMREFAAELDKIKEKYQEQKIIEQTAVDTFKQTESQKIAHLKAALAERETATDAVFAEELMKYGDNAAKKAQIELQFQKQVHQIQLEGLKLQEDVLKKSAQEWQSVLSGISGAFTSQLRGILQGTTTWSQAIKNIMLDLVLKIIDEFLKLAIIKPLSGMLASALAAPTEIFAALIKVISGMFGPLMAGFTSFFAPTQGPAAPAEGAAAAAATVAAATAAVALDTGTDYVPRTGLAMIHQGEAIIPASENMGQYSGGGGHSFNINLSAVDVQSFNAWLRNGGGANMLAKMISDTLRRSPTLRPSY